ncbi:MAG: sugar ABC transporter permease [Deltaproteobacteria bacterium]|nr:sugar ABC transporter permease [Deltaproteobacteria bacterium]
MAQPAISTKVPSHAAARRRFMFFLIAPAVFVLLAFEILPIFMGIDASLRRFILTDLQHPFIGLKNYIKVITDAQFYGVVLFNTFLFMFASVSGGLLLGLGLAVLLNRKFRGQNVVRTVIVFPMMVAPVVAATMVAWIFNDQFGIVNVIMRALGFEPVVWLVNRWSSMSIVILTDIWLWTPWYVLLILAALQNIPPEPHEAARIDGANEWQVFRSVTLPLLRPVLLVAIVIRSIDAFRVFDVVWTITRGEPGRMTEVFSIYSYKESFVFLDFGVGAASSIIGALIIMVIGVVLYFGLYYLSEL